MRLVFAGTPEAAVPSLAALMDSGHEIAAVVTRPDAPAGRAGGSPRARSRSTPHRLALRCSGQPGRGILTSWTGCARSRLTAAR